MGFQFALPSARITVIFLIMLVCMVSVGDGALVPGVKTWDNVQMWDNSALREVWNFVDEYLEFRKYALLKLSDAGYFDHLLKAR